MPNVAFPAAPVASLPEYIPHKTRHSIYRLKLTPLKVILDIFLSVITGSMSQAALTAVWCKWLQVRRYGGCETIMLGCDHNVLYPFRYVILGLLVLILERDLPVPKSIVQIRSLQRRSLWRCESRGVEVPRANFYALCIPVRKLSDFGAVVYEVPYFQ